MLDNLFNQTPLSITNVLLCILVSIVLGIVIALIYMYQNQYSKNFVITLVVLPTIVTVIIMLVNGNLGTSVAIFGTFSLIRFRSVPGGSKEITNIFLAVAVGLAIGMGFLTFAAMITIIIGFVVILLNKLKFGEVNRIEKDLKIMIPEHLDYTEIFNDLFDKFTKNNNLERVKTTNLGSMYELTYKVVMKDGVNEKEFIDELRCRNGNLSISLSRPLIKEDLL